MSFAIFITFVIFLYTMAQPSFKEEQKEQQLMIYLEKVLIENSSAELITITTNITNNVGAECIQLDNLITDFGIDNRIFVWNQEQVSTPSGASTTNLRINRISSNDDFFKIYYSEEFPYIGGGGEWSCQPMSEGSDYNLGITKVEKYIFESKLNDLFNEYNIWYDQFKGELKVPRSFEFGFGIIYENGTIKETPQINISKNFYIKDVPIQYVNLNGQIKSGYLRLKSW